MSALLRFAAPALLGLLAASCVNFSRDRSLSLHVDPGEEVRFRVRHAREAVLTSSGPGTVTVAVDGDESTGRWILEPGGSAPLREQRADVRVTNDSEEWSSVALSAKGGFWLELGAEFVHTDGEGVPPEPPEPPAPPAPPNDA